MLIARETIYVYKHDAGPLSVLLTGAAAGGVGDDQWCVCFKSGRTCQVNLSQGFSSAAATGYTWASAFLTPPFPHADRPTTQTVAAQGVRAVFMLGGRGRILGGSLAKRTRRRRDTGGLHFGRETVGTYYYEAQCLGSWQ